MLSLLPRCSVYLVLLAGFIIRAATPLGYMPAAAGSGLLFELCPDQLPAGITLAAQPSGHHHHDHGTADGSQADVDTCQIGHLLSSTAVSADLADPFTAQIEPPGINVPTSFAIFSAAPSTSRSRGPPA